MADFNSAVAKTLANEGGFADRRLTTGEVVNLGITLATLRNIGWRGVQHGSSLKGTDAEVAVVKALKKADAVTIYREWYWEPWGFGHMECQPLAEKAFDVGVNAYPVHAVKFLQQGSNDCNWPGPELSVDGHMGMLTLARINGLAPDDDSGTVLLEAFRKYAGRYYRTINGSDADRRAWLNRLAKG